MGRQRCIVNAVLTIELRLRIHFRRKLQHGARSYTQSCFPDKQRELLRQQPAVGIVNAEIKHCLPWLAAQIAHECDHSLAETLQWLTGQPLGSIRHQCTFQAQSLSPADAISSACLLLDAELFQIPDCTTISAG